MFTFARFRLEANGLRSNSSSWQAQPSSASEASWILRALIVAQKRKINRAQ